MPQKSASSSSSLSATALRTIKSIRDWNENSRQRAQALKPIIDRKTSIGNPVRQISTAYKYWRGKVERKGRAGGR
jgi:hypothetical protein